MGELILETKGLTKKFRKHKAVDNVDMHIEKGSIYGFIGRNGAGKTTFMKMISGLSNPTSGSITLPVSGTFINLHKHIKCIDENMSTSHTRID